MLISICCIFNFLKGNPWYVENSSTYQAFACMYIDEIIKQATYLYKEIENENPLLKMLM